MVLIHTEQLFQFGGVLNRFPLKLDISPAEDIDHWRLNKPFQYISKKYGAITACKGFVTNFASVPKIFRNIIQQWGDHGPASIIHDKTYDTGMFSRKTCDKIFLEAMKYSGVNFLKRQLMYRLVRFFGSSHYKGE